ncbi:MAG: TIGR02265 family protein [Archangium sp.]|nr:TIGR02265 family protein [Archangium sp.]
MSPALAADIARFRADSAERLARLRPTDTLKGLFVRRYLELFRELGGAPLERRGRDALQERRIFDFLNYPYAGVVQMGLAVVDELAPRYGGVDAWLDEMGRLATTSYLGSLLGRAFLAGFQPSPRAMLTGMPWAISTTFSFGERSVTFSHPSSCLFHCRREFSAAPSNAGAVRAAIEAVGAQDVRVGIKLLDLFNYDLEVSWREKS